MIRAPYLAAGLLHADVLGDLWLYNYTPKCTAQCAWDAVTLASRDIVFDARTDACVARPLPKFFGAWELEGALPWSELVCLEEKLDGHLGILYRDLVEGHPYYYFITTRGRFRSPSGAVATEILSEDHDLRGLDDALALCFEVLSPRTRVLVDYGDRRELVLLAAFDRHTGREVSLAVRDFLAARFGFRTPARFAAGELEGLLTANRANPAVEGYVARFANGLRVKFKTDWYLAAQDARVHHAQG